ncbi:MAG: DNA mismatch repair protein MutS [Tissierellia bacterium]|nr:DNA mismatch repair protein MutS [Tissierellia bacterium]
MFMDEDTKNALDFQYILNQIEVLTPYGKLLKGRMKAYIKGQEDEVKRHLYMIESYLPYIENNNIRREFNNILSHIKDLRQSIKRAMDGFVLQDVELFEIKNFLFLLRDLKTQIEKENIPAFKETQIEAIGSLEKILDPEDSKIATFYIYDAYSEDLKKIRKKKKERDNFIRSQKKMIKEKVKEDLDLDLRPDNSVEVSRENKALLKTIKTYPYLTYLSESYLNIKFTIIPTNEISEAERELDLLRDREDQEEMRIREYLSKEVGKKRREIFRNMLSIGKIDLLLAKTKLAIDLDGIKPEIINDHSIWIKDGRHPKIEDLLKKRDMKFTPISLSLTEGVACITGANMGGKTISLKLVGLLSEMAHYGMYVPAKEMKLGLSYYIKSSIGDMQSTDSGLSTFGGEVRVVSGAIKRADEQGIILIDELARGTNPEEGYAISKAIAKYLIDKPAITLLTTHYDNVADLDGIQHLQVVGLSDLKIEELEDEIISGDGMEIINKYMDYRLRKVDKTTQIPRDAINIAKIMGLKKEILQIAEEILVN